MKKTIICLAALIIMMQFIIAGTLEERANNLSKAEMQSVMEFMGSDLFEGRAPGTRGGDLAEGYIKSLFKFMNLEPGFNNKYLQPFKLKGSSVTEMTLDAEGQKLMYPDDFVGCYVKEEKQYEMEGDAVFVGFGITTPLWKWDDFKDTDVKGKILIARVNDPGMFIPSIFEGDILTYFGRWTYHLEEAARRGAAGMLLIHTDKTAGYGWHVVQNSWGAEELNLESDIKNSLKFRGWIKESVLKKILDKKNIKLEDLYKKSLDRKFRPIDLGISIKLKGKSQFRDVLNNNVVAIIPGKSKEKIVLSAHIDHLGKDSTKKGDNIYNGTIDNGSAVAALIMTTKILKEFQQDLHYSIVVLACNAEEQGLLGSKYYARTYPDKKEIITNINFESTPVWGKTDDFMAIGARFSTLEDMLKDVLKKQGLSYSYFSLSDQGFFYRSDQFSFARYDIPSMWISAGENDDSGQKLYPRFWKTEYHTVKDDFDPTWKLEGLKQTVKMTLLLIDRLNKSKEIPTWKQDKLTFPIETE